MPDELIEIPQASQEPAAPMVYEHPPARIAYEDVVKAYPALTTYPKATVEFWITKSPIVATEDRFGANVAAAELAYVAHAVVYSSAPVVKGRRAIPAHSAPPAPKTTREAHRHLAAGVWGHTTHGLLLASMARY